MKKVHLLMVVILIALFALAGTAFAQPLNFRAHLSGGQEVPPFDTKAQGQVIFQLDSSGSSMSYKLIVANIEDVVAAHIHCAPSGANGPVGVTLFASSPTGPVNGILAEGAITAPDSGNGCGWADLGEVVAALQSGDTYVNVHSLARLPGEIRGQIH